MNISLVNMIGAIEAMYHVLVPDNVDKRAIDLLVTNSAFTVNAPGKMAREDFLEAVTETNALIIRSGVTVDAEVFAAAPELKAIARAGVGVDNVDLEAATKHGVVVMNTPAGNTISTAEYTFGLMLDLTRNIAQGYHSMTAGKWDRKAFMGVELRGKTLGIVGFGRIGREVAKRAIAFDMTVIAHDPFVDADMADAYHVEMVDMDTLYARSDIITLHALITDTTREMICADSISRMKQGVYIVNAARGALINDDDLAAAIESGKVGGAALDVYHQEPPPAENPLIGLKNVVHTPHLAASTTDAQVQVGLDAANQIIEGLTNGNFQNVVNPDVLKT